MHNERQIISGLTLKLFLGSLLGFLLIREAGKKRLVQVDTFGQQEIGERETGYLLHCSTFAPLFIRSCINYFFQPFNYTFYYLLSGLSVLVLIVNLPQASTLDLNNEFVLET